MANTPEAMRLQAELDAELAAVTDAQTALLIAAWAQAWTEVSADLEDTLVELLAAGGRVSRAAMRRSLRLRRVLAGISERLTELVNDAAVTITSDLDAIVADAAGRQDTILAAMLPDTPDARDLLDVPLIRSDDRALEAIVKRSTQQITSTLRPVSAETASAIRRELIRSVAAGSGARDTAARMVRRTEGRFNGGLTRAMTISRTELLDAHRAAAKAGQERHTDVLTGWRWLAHLDPDICPACLAAHGTLFDLDVSGPDGHPNCRCSRMPQTQSWADLGFDGLDEPDDALPDSRAWFDALTTAEQKTLLGPERWRLLDTGAITWDDLGQVRRNTGWRDSLQVTPVRDLGRRAQPSRGRRAS